MYKLHLLCLCYILISAKTSAQTAAPPSASSFVFMDKAIDESIHRFKWGYVVAPAVVVGMAAIQHTSWVTNFNHKVQDMVAKNNFHSRIDDYTQYVPAASVLVLEAAGLHGRHKLGNKAIIMATATLIELALVNAMKYTMRTMRPDGSSRNSFPSGHTATAFMGAELLRLEYGHRSVWYAVGGYAAAAFTGYMRTQNNRHWFSDVVCGAAAGVFAAQAAWLLYPHLHKLIFPTKKNHTFMLMPYGTGMGAVVILQ
jgi:membrane-associated phospholipid phosphatase